MSSILKSRDEQRLTIQTNRYKYILELDFMLELEPIWEFSRNNCVAICSFLVPANIVATLMTCVLVIMKRSPEQISWSIATASIMAIALFVHISTWFAIGVITPITFILFGLGTTCLTVNTLAFIYRQQISQFVWSYRSTTK